MRRETWWKLWAAELAVAAWGLVRLVHAVWPSSGPFPGWKDLALVGDWAQALRWPSPWSVAGRMLPVLVLAVLVVVVDMVVLRHWRTRRLLQDRWRKRTRRSMNDSPRLIHVRRRGGVVDASVVLRSGNWDALATQLDTEKGSLLRGLKLGRELGSPVRARVLTEGCRNPARVRKLRLFYLPLGRPDSFPAYEMPADGSKVMVGHTVEGPLVVDLEKTPHLRVVGGTGSGKGYYVRLLEVQVLRAGWLGILLDGGNSPEHALLDPAPTFLRPMRSTMTVEERLRAAIAAVKALKALADARSSIAEAFGASRWVEIPADVRAWLPRVALVVDETTAMLAESKDKPLDALRQQLRTALDTDALRNGRKFAIHVLPLSDQFAYSGVLAKAASMQAEGVLVLGNMAPEHVKQATGLASLPVVPEEARCGHFVWFGNPNAREVRLPSNHPDSLRRAVDFVVEATSS